MPLQHTDGPGRLVLVVGPSGVGVDSLIDAARANLHDTPDVRFVQRVITRDGSAGGEDHIPATEEAFEQLARAGAFALHWQAHGYRYGVPADIDADIRAGRTVVVNASRTVIETARDRYTHLVIASITASAETLASRLRGRNRETEDEIQRRLARAASYTPSGSDVVVVDNDGALEESTKTFLALLRPA